jgi:primosomal protein N' (replication factor Y)
MKREQQSLFDLSPAPWELDDACEQLVATVVFARGPKDPFDYQVPDNLRGQVLPGQRVRAPLGKSGRLALGYCVRVGNSQSPGQLKSIESVIDMRPLLSASMLQLTQWMADYYLCSWGQVLETVVPGGVRGQAGTRITHFVSLPSHVHARLTRLRLTPTQKRVMERLVGRGEPMPIQQLAKAASCGTKPIRGMVDKGLLALHAGRFDAREAEPADAHPREEHLTLNPDQGRALGTILSALECREHRTILMHGVTGSGKTEVYIQAIQEVLRFGRQAIVLVPEISLTPQTEARFRSRFGAVAVLHSHQSDAERRRQWDQIASASVSVVVGARSAVFAPAPNLGLIVLDEEHETSFKQDSAPRYHARDVALERSRAEGVPLVLGSATPSLESWQRVLEGTYELASLPKRVLDRPLPSVGTIDLRLESADRRGRGAISRQLRLAMEESLQDGGQVILLLNRRGYSTHIQCPACGLVLRCPHCAIALTHHLHVAQAICHYCDYQERASRQCPQCGFEGIHYRGLGTERLEAEVKARFPNHACLRMDTDTMRKPGSHEWALAKFRDGEVRILVGTQMIAKGLDFPNVTLVGVINADTALHFPDFRAAERTFQLVTQVAGRTGRGERGGRVLVQTFSPEHAAIVAAVRHDFHLFASQELPVRESLGYPPYGAMIRLVVRGPAELSTGEFAGDIARRLTQVLEKSQTPSRVLGPAPAPIAKIRGKFRFQIQLQSSQSRQLREAVRQATATLKAPEDIQWMADVDPIDML